MTIIGMTDGKKRRVEGGRLIEQLRRIIDGETAHCYVTPAISSTVFPSTVFDTVHCHLTFEN